MICTFYSFKGGVGRSMALANLAYLLYKRGLKVLVIDFDLEAPGLERFFKLHDSVMQPADIIKKRGLIDLLVSYQDSFGNSEQLGKPRLTNFSEPLLRFIEPIYFLNSKGGSLHILPAGKRDRGNINRYNEGILNFDWISFFEEKNGIEFFERFRSDLKLYSDIVLVDSRTGTNDVGGLCTHQLADVVIMFVSPTDRSIEETRNLAKSLSNPKLIAEDRKNRPLSLLFIPSRVELSESDLLNQFESNFIQAFKEFIPNNFELDKDIFNEVYIPYVSLYAYEERLAAYDYDLDRNIHALQLVEPYQKLADLLLKVCDIKENSSFGGSPSSSLKESNSPLLSSEKVDYFDRGTLGDESQLAPPSTIPKTTNLRKNKIDYESLSNFLAEGQWRDADRETMQIILKICDRQREGWLRREDIAKISCEELFKIDNLWKQFSFHRFGFSTQQQLWEEVGGDSQKFDYKTFCEFGEQVGWRVTTELKPEWIGDYNRFEFSLEAPRGHLPSSSFPDQESETVKFQDWRNHFERLFSLLAECQQKHGWYYDEQKP